MQKGKAKPEFPGHRGGITFRLMQMPADNEKNANQIEPKGLGEHEMGPEAKAAQEQGWGLNEDERRKPPKGRPDHYGGIGYDYGAQDFGDTPAKRDNPEGVEEQPPDEDRKAS